MSKSIRILLAIAAYYDYEIWHMNVKTDFLNGNLQEEVYMTQPDGFNTQDTTKVATWITKELGFLKNPDENCVYKKEDREIKIFLVLYVDDILLIGNDIPALQYVKQWLF